jgi:hypothetical protein
LIPAHQGARIAYIFWAVRFPTGALSQDLRFPPSKLELEEHQNFATPLALFKLYQHVIEDRLSLKRGAGTISVDLNAVVVTRRGNMQ